MRNKMRIRPVVSGLLGVVLVGVIGLILGPELGFQPLRKASDLPSSGGAAGVATDSSSAGSQLQTGLPADGAPASDQDAERPTLLEVLERTGEEAGFLVTVIRTVSLDERVSLEKERGPLVEFVRRLLVRFSKVLVFAPDTDGKQGRLIEVIVVSASPAETMVASSGDSDDALTAGWNRRAAAMLDSLDPRHPETYMATVEALKDLAPEQAADALVESGVDAERNRDAERVSERLDTGDLAPFTFGLRALEEFAPEQAAEFATDAPDLESSGDEVAQRPSVANIAALGMTGDPGALGLLIEAFQGPDPRVRQVAAQAIAALGQPDADAFLLEASRDARLDWSEPAKMAIVLRRSPEASSASPGAVGPQYLTRYLGSR